MATLQGRAEALRASEFQKRAAAPSAVGWFANLRTTRTYDRCHARPKKGPTYRVSY